jgi:hypothetical protein
VQSQPVGIDCGAACAAAFAEHTMVTLTPSVVAGSRFASWSGGGCSGTAPCLLDIDAAKQVTATFDLLPIEAAASALQPARRIGLVPP